MPPPTIAICVWTLPLASVIGPVLASETPSGPLVASAALLPSSVASEPESLGGSAGFVSSPVHPVIALAPAAVRKPAPAAEASRNRRRDRARASVSIWTYSASGIPLAVAARLARNSRKSPFMTGERAIEKTSPGRKPTRP